MFKTKIKQHISWQRILAFVGLCFLVILSLHHPLNAQAISEGYNADQPLERGMIIRLKSGDETKIEAVGANQAEFMHGVVIGANDAPVTLAADGQKTFVASSGQYDVLVSNQNGNISAGDYITVSSLAGIGMKAGSQQTYIVGRAKANFNDSQAGASTAEVKTDKGTTSQVAIGRIQVEIGVAKNPLLKGASSGAPSILQKAGESIAGKPVSTLHIYLGLVLFIITTILASSLLYGGVRSAITSIGRNPLSRKSIVGGMIQVVLTGLIVFITGVFGVYLILRL